ncbi:RWD domain-containing protein [Sodiomyces alkalinus F11]|uniref:RWD domain-containing protein n=1 Tax=Sodiomyces alkalinus (strain CBS 110278 / VKM F-3762 / F11) TaxID=1314773 RepID=A0A3N2PR53_SODAK|nr:RWD domain-containing protein [Sodiomyces alkalinus F11]ROT36992.1 RWD domain-containing protein [Sodiomyces alkalinus F11]
MGREEQIEEREVLESIFPDEITEISDTEFRIKITLDLDVQEEQDDDLPTMLLYVRYPEAYPDEPPFLDIQAPPNTVSSPDLPFSVSEDKTQLMEALEVAIQENLGMAMVFSLVTTLKDAAEQLIADRRAEQEKVREEAAMAVEREENKKFQGTAVNRETFLRWRDAFMREMEENRVREEEERLAELKKARVKEPVKLTGRQLWERGLAGKTDAEEVDDEDGISQGLEKLKVEAT